MGKPVTKQGSDAIYRAVLELKDLDECRRFFEDISAPSELRAMEQRFDVALMLNRGMVYTDIMDATGASSATISRVNRMLASGTGCLRDILDRSFTEDGENR